MYQTITEQNRVVYSI